MITRTAILDAICREVATARGEDTAYTMYVDVMPGNFSRPAFFAFLGERKTDDGNAGLLEITQPVTVQCIDEVDDHYEASTARLAAVADSIEAAFCIGHLRVGTRALHIEGLKTQRDVDVMNITMTLHYYDERPGQGEDAPLIERVDTNVTVN